MLNEKHNRNTLRFLVISFFSAKFIRNNKKINERDAYAVTSCKSTFTFFRRKKL